MLHCGLNTEQQVAEEEDVVWEWNKLFTEVVSIITANKEAENAGDETLGVGDEEITCLLNSITIPTLLPAAAFFLGGILLIKLTIIINSN